MNIRSFTDLRIESWFRTKLFTNIPARVMNVDKYQSECVIDVQPIIADIRPADNLVDKFPMILDVPVLIYSGGGAVVTVPIQVGDIVQLEVNMRNIQNWLDGSTDEIVLPSDSGAFNLNDCVAKPCVYSKTNNPNPNPEDLELRFNNSIVRLKQDGNITISTGGNITVEQAVNIEVNNSGNTTVNTSGSSSVNVGGTTTLTSAGSVTIDTSSTTITGSLRVDGSISSGGDVSVDSGQTLATHKHLENNITPSGTGPTGPAIP